MERITLSVHGLDRRYLLAGATNDGPVSPRPVMVVLHGTGGTAAWADDETGWSRFAADRGFLVALPDGVPLDPARPPKFLTNPSRWADGSAFVLRPPAPGSHPDIGPVGDPDDIAFLTAVVADLVARGADRRRVYLTGFSNGAGMAFRFAAERAELLAAVAPVAGYCWTDAVPARPVPTLYVLGTADPLIPVRGGPVRLPWGGRLVKRPAVAVTLEKWASANRCGPPVTVREADGIREDVYPGPIEMRAVYLDGLGHHWPGGKGQLGERVGGPATDRYDGNDLVWEFCRRHHL
ncbi:MAG: hypothetical protein U0871_09950 [Gemmataceae bacterium]